MLQILAIIFGSGVVSAFFTHFLTTGAAEKKFRREKLEELYLAARKHSEGLVNRAISYRKQEEPPPATRLKWEEERDRLSETVEMLTNLYFPELLSGLLTFHGNFESFIKPDSNLTEKELKESAASFVANTVFTVLICELRNRPRIGFAT